MNLRRAIIGALAALALAGCGASTPTAAPTTAGSSAASGAVGTDAASTVAPTTVAQTTTTAEPKAVKGKKIDSVEQANVALAAAGMCQLVENPPEEGDMDLGIHVLDYTCPFAPGYTLDWALYDNVEGLRSVRLMLDGYLGELAKSFGTESFDFVVADGARWSAGIDTDSQQANATDEDLALLEQVADALGGEVEHVEL